MKWKNMLSETPQIGLKDQIEVTWYGVELEVYMHDGRRVNRARARFSFPPGKSYQDLRDACHLDQQDADSCRFIKWVFSCELEDLISYENHDLERMFWEKDIAVDSHLISLETMFQEVCMEAREMGH